MEPRKKIILETKAKAEEDKIAKEKKDEVAEGKKAKFFPFLKLLATILLIVLAVFLLWKTLPEPTTDGKVQFPLVAWFAIVAATLLLRAGVELYYIWANKKKGNIWIGLDMLCIGLVLLSVIISFLYIDKPEEWWSNIWAEKGPGKFLLITLGLTLILWFILPGTGSITLKLGKPFCIIIGLGLVIILIFTATGGELKENDQWIWQKWFEGKKVEAKISPRTSQERIVLFRNFNLTKTEKFIGIINPGERFQYISPVWFYLKTEIGEKVPYMPSQNPGEIRYIQSDFGNILPGGYRLYISSKDQAAIIKYRFK